MKTPQPKKPREKKNSGFGVRWSEEERRAIDGCAADKGVGPTQVIRMAVKKYLDEHRRSKGAES